MVKVNKLKMKKLKIATIIGVRPQFIKAATVSTAIAKHNRLSSTPLIRELYIHTGQHYNYEMSESFFRELRLPKPTYHLNVIHGSPTAQIGETLKRLGSILIKENPDIILVYGDANPTLAGALAAAKLHLPVAHVEAGLRSFNRQMPEEINRLLTDHLSYWLFCPSQQAVENLKKEGIQKGVYLVGDVMYDIFLSHSAKILKKQKSLLAKHSLRPRSYALATIHRAESTDQPNRLRHIFLALEQLAKDSMPVILPLHPRTQKVLKSSKISLEHITILPPISYQEMLCLEANAKAILTDSGGVQKEAYWLSVPCVTIREETEWVETVKTGWNTIVGFNSEKILTAALKAFPIDNHPNLYGDGQAASRIINYLIKSKK